MKRSGKLLVAVIGIFVSGSIALAAPVDMDAYVDGNVDPLDYDYAFVDTDDIGTEAFVGTGADIKAMYFGQKQGLAFPGDPTDVWYTFGMTVVGAAVNTTGDGTGAPSPSSVSLVLSQGGVERNTVVAMMFHGNVLPPIMLDATHTPITLNPSDVKYKVGADLEIAIKANKFSLAPAAFDFSLNFEGGGQNADDHMVPEPATMSMLAIGGLVALRRRRRKRD